MCRAVKVLCVARDAGLLAELKRAAVSADWELTPGATEETEALRQVHEERPHVLVVFGPFDRLVRRAVEASPGLRVVADRDVGVGSEVVGGLDAVRAAVRGRPHPGGPVR